MRRKGLALFLCVCMCLTGRPVGILAAEDAARVEEPEAAEEMYGQKEPEAGEEAVPDSMESAKADVTAIPEGEAEIVDSGIYQGIEWTVDAGGHMILDGKEEADGSGYGEAKERPWVSYIRYKGDVKVVSIEVRGSGWVNMRDMYRECDNLVSVDFSAADTKNVTDMSGMFDGCHSLTTLDMSGLDTGNVTDMSRMFQDCSGLTTLDMSGLNTGNVTTMRSMFWGCKSLEVLDVSGFDTGNVTDMSEMFYGCSGLKALDVSGFDTGKVTDMSEMFHGCSGLTTLNVIGLDTGKVTDMSFMFAGCNSLTTLGVSGFDTRNVTDMSRMFYDCSGLTTLDVIGLDTGNVTDMSFMFAGCNSLTTLDVSGFDTRNVTDMSFMFFSCKSLEVLDVSAFDTGKVTHMSGMFYGCSSLEVLDVSGFDTRNVTDMGSMFEDCHSLVALDVSGFDTGKVTHMFGMFYGCSGLKALDVSGFDTGNVTEMANMFRGCESLEALDVNGFDTGNVTNEEWSQGMAGMFDGCSGLTALDVSGFNTEKVTDMSRMFRDCANLAILDISGFDTKNVTDMSRMFEGCSKLSTSINIRKTINTYDRCFTEAATEPGSKIIVKYGGGCSGDLAKQIVETKSENSHVYLEGKEVTANTVVLDRTELTLKRGETADLLPTVTPIDAWEAYSWRSDDPSVASVDKNGKVKGVSEGQTTIRLTVGVAHAECSVAVSHETAIPLPPSGRIAGTSRYSTAWECAEQMRSSSPYTTAEGKFTAAVVACADNFPDALAGSTLAASVHAPILLVGKNSSGTNETLEYISKNVEKSGIVYLLGGTGAIPESVSLSLLSYGFKAENIRTLAGSSRYETNLKIADELAVPKATDIVIVSGKTYADSLSISGIAGAKGMPIFLAAGTLSEEAVNKIREIAPEHIYIIGGTAAVSETVFAQAERLCASGSNGVVRIAGTSRYATSLAVAEYFGMEKASSAVFAYGGDFPDGLTGGAFAAGLNAPVILVSDENYEEQEKFLQNSSIEKTYVMGGTSAISDETMKHLMK